MLNPYGNRGPIDQLEDFFGRDRELSEVRGGIAHSTWVSLIGERRVGKSSILNALRFDAEAMDAYGSGDYLFVFVDCQYFEKATEEQFILYLLERIQDDVEVSLFPVDRMSLGRIADAIRRDSPTRRLVLLLDEIDVLARNDRIPQGFFASLRGWSQNYKVPLVAASKESSMESLVWNENVGSPFWNLFKPLYIGPFEEAEALELVQTPAQTQGCAFSEEEVQWILTLGGHQPFFLQIACDHMFRAKIAGLVGKEAFAQADLEFRQEATPHLEYLWRGLPDSERGALVDYVTSQARMKDDMRLQLLKKGLLVEDGTSNLHVFSSVLADRLRDQATREPTKRSLLGLLWDTFLK